MIGIFALSMTVFCALPVAALAIDFGGISARPANPNAGDERTSAWFVYTLAPGGFANDALLVQNNSDEQKTFDLYPADSTPTTGSGFALKQKVEKMTEVGSWIKLEKNSLALAPHEKATVFLTVTVPKNIKPGLYAGGVMIGENGGQKEKSGVNINTRIGVRAYVTVAPPKAVPSASSNWARLVAGALALIAIAGLALMIFGAKKKPLKRKLTFSK